jgi:glutathione S-transferase
MPDGTYIMDSRKIADALEKLKPEPSFRLDSGYVEQIQDAVLDAWKALAPIALPRVADILLNPPSADYFRETRAERFGMPLSELAKCDKAGEAAWKNAEPSMQKLEKLLHEHEEGPYVLGTEASYADLILAGFFKILLRLDLYVRFTEKANDVVFGKLYEACGKWVEKDD